MHRYYTLNTHTQTNTDIDPYTHPHTLRLGTFTEYLALQLKKHPVLFMHISMMKCTKADMSTNTRIHTCTSVVVRTLSDIMLSLVCCP